MVYDQNSSAANNSMLTVIYVDFCNDHGSGGDDDGVDGMMIVVMM